jgi:hypothetical protein
MGASFLFTLINKLDKEVQHNFFTHTRLSADD